MSSLELADEEDPVESLRVRVIISGRPAAIEAVHDRDGELSGVLQDQEAISGVTEIDAESLQTWANAVWWSARDAVFLAGLTRAERLAEELTDRLRAD